MRGRREVVVALIGLVVVGCGIQPTAPVRGGPAVSIPGQEAGIEVCFLQGGAVVPVERNDVVLEGAEHTETTAEPEPRLSERSSAIDKPSAGNHAWTDLRKIGNLLALGPSPDERAQGLTTEVPADLTLGLGGALGVTRAYVDGIPLPPAYKTSPDESAETIGVAVVDPVEGLPANALRQIACTLQSYRELIGEERAFVITDGWGVPYPEVP